MGHVFRRYCILNHIVEGKTEGRIKVTGRRGKRRRQLTDDLKEKTGHRRLKAEKLDLLYGEGDRGSTVDKLL